MTNDLNLQFKAALGPSEQFGVKRFSDKEIDIFCRYYQLVLKWNSLLHLTTITNPVEFVQRHIFESAFTEKHILTSIHQVWDIGSGLGIPGIPIAVLRPDLPVNLIESNRKKAIFLKEVVGALQINNIRVLNQRFEEIKDTTESDCVVTRALDGMHGLLPVVLKLVQACAQTLLLGNPTLSQATAQHISPEWQLINHPFPKSQNRLLIILTRST